MTYGSQPDPNQPAISDAPPIPPGPGIPQAPAPAGYGTPPPTAGQPVAGQYGASGYGSQPGAPWGGAPMQRPSQTTSGAVMAIIGGALLTILGIILAAVGGNPDIVSEAGLGSDMAALISTLGVVALLLGAASLVLGIFVLKQKWWAAIALAVLAGLYVVGAIYNMVSGASQALFGIVWVGISTALILSPQSRTWLRAGR